MRAPDIAIIGHVYYNLYANVILRRGEGAVCSPTSICLRAERGSRAPGRRAQTAVKRSEKLAW